MAPSVDGLSSIFTAIEPPQASTPPSSSSNTASSRRDSGGFADHLQQAAKNKPSSNEQGAASSNSTTRADKRSAANQKATSSKKPTSNDTPSTEAKATESTDQTTKTDDTKSDAPADASATSTTDDTVKDANATDKEQADKDAASDALTAVLQAAQVVVPEVIVAPQEEIAVHTEVATAGDKDQGNQKPDTKAAAEAAAVETLPTTDPTAEKKVDGGEKVTKAVDAVQGVEIVKPQEHLAAKESKQNQVVTDVQETVTTKQPTEVTPTEVNVAQLEQVTATVAADTGTERKAQNDQNDAADSALKNDVTQVVAPAAAAAATSTTVVSAISSGGNLAKDDRSSKQDKTKESAEIKPIDGTTSNDRTVTGDGGVPRHARLVLDTLTNSAGKAECTTTLTEAERVRFVQRVTNAIQSAAETGGPIRLRLSPPELGAVRIEMTIVAGQMSVRMEAETPQARTALLDNLPVLRERLEAQDIKIAKFDVDLFGGSPGNLSQSPQRDPNQDAPLPRHQLRRDAAGLEIPDATSAVGRPTVSNDGRLNVLI
jgi:flagellar hook-length control protein FliK